MDRFAVVGAGVAGLSTAYALAQKGHSVTVFEQFDPFHDLGSSHGRSRIIRRAYPDRHLTEIMLEAYPLWSDLEAALGQVLVNEVGLAYFGPRDSENLASVRAGLEACNVTHQVFAGNAAHEVIPALTIKPDEIAIWTPEAGWVDSEATLRGLHQLGRDLGVEYKFETRIELEELETNFDRYAVCAGSWVRQWVDLDVKVTKQTFAYVDAQIEGPVWIEDSPELAYGFPSDAWGMKVALHSLGEVIEPQQDSSQPDQPTIERIKRVATERFGIQIPQVAHAKTCRYTNTPDEGFRFGTIGTKGVYCSACSGHAFKFGPWLGQHMAKMMS